MPLIHLSALLCVCVCVCACVCVCVCVRILRASVKDVFSITGKQATSWVILHHEINFASYASNE